ncbi:MAG: hypothetical protein WB679_15870 [Terracidiphilus sp.]
MNSLCVSIVNTLHPAHLPSWLKRLVVAAFLSFGLAVPFASASCANKSLERYVSAPSATSTLAVTANSAAPLSTLKTPPSIVGLWNVTFSSGGEVVDVAFDAWHSDGTEILNDFTDPIEGNVCLGAWEQSGALTYKLKHPSWSFDSNGTLLGTVIIHEIVNLSSDGNSYNGGYKYDIYDTAGVFQEEFTGTIKATRIKPD